MRRAATAVAAVVVALALAAGCGSSPEVSDEASDALRPALHEVRAAAEDRQADVVAARLVELRTAVASLREQGEISEERAGEILAAANAVEAQLPLITTTTTEPPAPAREADEDDDEERGKGRDRGKAKVRDD